MNDAIQSAVARAKALPCWNDPQDIAPLGGGITNINLTVQDSGKSYVVRLGQDIPEHGVMRFNELTISRAAHAAGVAPAVHYAEPGAMVLDFVDAAPMSDTDLHDEDTLIEVTKLIGKAHRHVTTLTRGPVLTFWVFHVLRDYSEFLKNNGSPHLPKLAALMDDAVALERAVGAVSLVIGHNDLLPANILRGADRLWLIDWEYGGFNSPLFDLGGLATNCDLPPEAEHLMLNTYFGHAPDEVLLRAYGAMKCASLLRETMWSMVAEQTSQIEFDYAAYTADNLSRYRQAMNEYKSQRGMI